MRLKPKISIADHFGEMEDPRVERSIQHKLIDIITIAICAVICGADTWVDIEAYGLARVRVVKAVFRITKWNSKS
jgi:predicted transposase YbfD/YdcC